MTEKIGKRACFVSPAVLAALLVLSPVFAAGFERDDSGRGLRLTGSAGVGFDSYQEKYTIVEEDTLDSVNEFRTRLSLGLMTGSYLRDFFLLEGRTRYGDDSWESGARLRFSKLLGGGLSRVGIETDYTRRTFGEKSSYQFPNNFGRLYLRAYFKYNFDRAFALRVTDRLESQDFENHTEFDYDYVRNKFSIGGEYDWDFTTLLDARLTVVSMEIPDSSEIEYRSLIPSIEVRSFAGLTKRGFVQAALERREYVAGSPRSDFWSVLAIASGEWPLRPSFSLALNNDFEWYVYDVKDEIYFDFLENRTALLFKLNHMYELSFGAGPAFGFLNSAVSDDDEYREYGARFMLEYNRGIAAWLTASYEPGKRIYSSYTGIETVDAPPLFSDYSYHRVSLFANMRIRDGIVLNCFADYQPEDHIREGDDATATLLSVSLTWTF